MSESTTSERKLTAAERKAKALERRKGGLTYELIGQELGVTRQAAHLLVKSALKELNEKTMESAAELQQLEMERLDVMRAAIWGSVLKGDVLAIDRALKISARLAALRGLDAPTKTDVTSGGKELTVVIQRASDAVKDNAE